MKDSSENNPLLTTRHELDKIREYEAKGYTASYRMNDGALIDLSTGKGYGVDEIEIVDEYRYEGMSAPDDLSILFALNMSDGTRGLILRPYGAAANEEMDSFLSKVPRKNKGYANRSDLRKVADK